jgi:hypothetical protein
MKIEKEKLMKIVKEYTKEDILRLKMKSPKHPKEIDLSKSRK